MDRRKFIGRSLAVTATSATAALAGGNTAIEALTAFPETTENKADFTFARLRYASGNWDADPRMPANLLHSLAEHTPLRVCPDEQIVDVGAQSLTDYPFVYLTGNRKVSFTEDERTNLRRYLRGGGFMFVDDCEHDTDGAFASSFERELGLILDRPEESLQKLPNDHALYSSFFMFENGPPATSHELNGWGDRALHDYLRAVHIKGRIAVLYSNKDYGCEWNYDPANRRFAAHDNTRFGINIITYAMQKKL